jgi:glutathione S-transferase
MQRIVADLLRPAADRDPHGVEQARATLRTAYSVIDGDMRHATWAVGDDLTLADCAAAPALFYANVVEPFGAEQQHLASYLRLMERSSYARVLEEARPYFAMFPMRAELEQRYPGM